MKEKYSNIKKCPWCEVKPSLIIAPHENTIMFDITLGCTNEKCKFNPTCHSSATANGIDSFISEMIAEWNVRSDDKVPEPPKIEMTIDTESKWTLSEALDEVKENDVKCISCVHHIVSKNNKHWCKRYACSAWAALIGCQYKGFIDKSSQEEKTDNSDVTDTKCLHCWYSFLDEDNYLWCKRYSRLTESAIKKCRYEDLIDETEEIKCADCVYSFPTSGDECCNLYEPSFPKPCDKFESMYEFKEDSE